MKRLLKIVSCLNIIKLTKNENKYYATVDNKQILISDKFEIKDNSIIYYDNEHYNILTPETYKDSVYINHYTVYNLDNSGIMMV